MASFTFFEELGSKASSTMRLKNIVKTVYKVKQRQANDAGDKRDLLGQQEPKIEREAVVGHLMSRATTTG
ncbi:hypothetical protein [Granulicella tundricola]|uniref:hypothetical protein n=1 Tax=Granulicella tundricola TaxID=940615 RepID=UPI00059EF9D7|nr:hypothetical protein [Granulicella tundricola]